MKIPFQQFFNRITSITTPVVGVAWNPPALEADVATRLMRFLEDRRVLYEPYEAESVSGCIQSVYLIRSRLTADMEKLKPDSELAAVLSFMRAACRRFLDTVQAGDLTRAHLFGQLGMGGQMVFGQALGALRATFGYNLAYISVKYGIDVEEQLARIFPAAPHDDDSLEAGLPY